MRFFLCSNSQIVQIVHARTMILSARAWRERLTNRQLPRAFKEREDKGRRAQKRNASIQSYASESLRFGYVTLEGVGALGGEKERNGKEREATE